MNPQKMAIKYRALIKERDPHILTSHDEKTHGYMSPKTGRRYKSTTWFTGMLKDPSIMEFKMNRALAYIAENWQQVAIHKKSIGELIDLAKLAPQDIFETAGDWGNAAHAWREEWFKKWIDSGETTLSRSFIENYPLPENVDGEVTSACRAIKKFLIDTGYIPVFCEIPLVDDVLEVGGQADDGGIFPNPKKEFKPQPPPGEDDWRHGAYKIHYKPYFAFVDLKTSNQGKKPAYAYQVRGFYQPMFTKIYKIRPQKTYILHTSKENGTYKLIDLTGAKFLVKESKYLVKLSRSYDRVKEYFEPKPMTI